MDKCNKEIDDTSNLNYVDGIICEMNNTLLNSTAVMKMIVYLHAPSMQRG